MNAFFSGNELINVKECTDCYDSWCPQKCSNIMWNCFVDVCTHKDLFPINYSDLFLALLIFGTTMLSTLSGVGGGAIDVLILMFVGSFPLEMAVPLALCDVFGACIVKFCYFVKRRNPLNYYKYLANYKIVLLFVPLYGTFTYIGYLLNALSPYIFSLCVLFVVLCVSLYKSLVKLYMLYKNKGSCVKDRAEIDGIYDVLVEKESVLMENVCVEMDYTYVNVSKYDLDLYSIMRHKEKLFELLLLNGICIGINLVLLLFTFLKLIDEIKIFVYIIQLIFSFFVVFLVTCYIFLNKNKKDTIVWNIFNILKLIIASCITGVVSSYVGIGGGMIMNPILVSMKVPPHVVLATYGVSAFYSVTIAIMQYFIFGTVPLAYAFLFFICGIAGALCGVFLLHFLNSQKAIVWSMVLLFLVSIMAVFVSFVLEMRGLQVLQDLQDLQEI